jgi:hypothetical protein
MPRWGLNSEISFNLQILNLNGLDAVRKRYEDLFVMSLYDSLVSKNNAGVKSAERVDSFDAVKGFISKFSFKKAEVQNRYRHFRDRHLMHCEKMTD